MHLRRSLIRARIDARYGGSAARLASALGLHRSTVTRWLDPASGVMPRDSEVVLALGAALDVDPALLWDIPASEFPAVCARARDASCSGNWDALHGSLAFIRGFIRPSSAAAWPPPEIAARYQRAWTVSRVAHAPETAAGVYADLVLRSDRTAPQAWHFASLDTGAPAPAAPEVLGTVARVGEALALYGINGVSMRRATEPGVDRVAAQVWLGGRAQTFLVASLHPFELCRADGSDLPRLRFCLRGIACDRADDGGLCALRAACTAYRPTRG